MKLLKPILFAAAFLAHVISSPAADTEDFRRDINPALLYFQAYQYIPHFSEADTTHLFDNSNSWLGQPLDERALGLLKQYDNTFKLVRRARFARVPCEWGYDLSDGPEALLPGLAPAKRISQAARLRAMAAMDANQFDIMREEMISAYALGRNLATDKILISDLVQIAIENILTSVIMENYHRLSAQQLDQLVKDFDAAPRRGLIVDTISTENDSFYGSIHRSVRKMITESAGNTNLFWNNFVKFWNHVASEPDSKTGPEPSADRIRQIANSDPDGVLRLLDELPALYNETAQVMALPYLDYKVHAPVLWAKIARAENPFIKQFLTLFQNLRGKEFSAVVRQEMVRAAAAYKQSGLEAMRAIQDPLVGRPFEFSRVEFEGVDRGFQLKSAELFRDFPEVMIFVEKPGKPFRLDGKNAGQSR